jgi:SF3a60/Prp9 C-terminal
VNDDSEEEDDFIYNPLKLPMGWDGKPIPYWLYKLHGLNQVPLWLPAAAVFQQM